ncbi:caspase family protein [Sphingomonas sp. ERG5]|uniref:caspase family protein n=1 Tax=Sphingomonas sp. ERG5 TaxID=1381597 RepID=UPI00054B5A1B|nr:caspase family protein [Sphingomonas sp. ERG5]
MVGETAYPQRLSYVGQQWDTLPVSTRDAQAMAALLQTRGFELVGGGAQLNLTRAGLDQALAALMAAARGRHAIVLVYISGHGFTFQGKTLVAPIDSPRPIPGFFGENSSRLGVEEIDTALKAADPLLTMILLDACRDSPPSGEAISGAQDSLGDRTLLGLAAERGAPVSVPVDPKIARSAYTDALLGAIDAATDQQALATVFDEANAMVSALSSKSQNPRYRFGNSTLQLGDVPTGMIFGRPGSAPRVRSAANYDPERLARAVDMMDFIKLCFIPPEEEDKKGLHEVQFLMAKMMLLTRDEASLKAACVGIHDRASAYLARHPEMQGSRGIGDYSDGLEEAVKLAAEQGNAHAALQTFIYFKDGMSVIGLTDDAFSGDLAQAKRTSLEYLFMAADAGDPYAMFLAGKNLAPSMKNGTYFATMPDAFKDNFATGRRYLEGALDHGIADAGYLLADIATRNLTGFPTHPELYRNYLERAFAAQPLFVDAGQILHFRFELADDFLNSRVRPRDPAKAVALLRQIYASPVDATDDGLSIRGNAAWLLAYALRGNRASSDPAAREEFRSFAAAAAELGIPNAESYVGSVLISGTDGFTKDLARGQEFLRKARAAAAADAATNPSPPRSGARRPTSPPPGGARSAKRSSRVPRR